MKRSVRSAPVPQVYLIGTIGELSVPLVRRMSAAARKAGVRLAVQLRDKEKHDREILEHARRLVPVVPLFVNGRPHVAAAAGAAGVHLGPSTLSVADVIRIFPSLRIGWSAHSAAELKAAAGASFAVLSPFAEPVSKPLDRRPPLGADAFARLASRSPVPVLALGGLTPENSSGAFHAWAEGIAVSGGVFGAKNPFAAFRRYLAAAGGTHG